MTLWSKRSLVASAFLETYIVIIIIVIHRYCSHIYFLLFVSVLAHWKASTEVAPLIVAQILAPRDLAS